MNAPLAEIEDAALALTASQRADLAYTLLRSLPRGPGPDADSPHLAVELDHRMAAYEAGQTTADDWQTVSARLQQALENRSGR